MNDASYIKVSVAVLRQCIINYKNHKLVLLEDGQRKRIDEFIQAHKNSLWTKFISIFSPGFANITREEMLVRVKANKRWDSPYCDYHWPNSSYNYAIANLKPIELMVYNSSASEEIYLASNYSYLLAHKNKV